MAQNFKVYKKLSFIILTLSCLFFYRCHSQQELSIHDFKFDGSLGSQGATITKIKKNHFKVILGHAPNHPDWANMLQFQITDHAKGNSLRLDVEFVHDSPLYLFNDYSYSWSYDGMNWYPVHWKGYQVSIKNSDVLLFPEFTENTVYMGHQAPISYEDLNQLITEWEKSPFVKALIIGKSIENRNIYRLEVTDETFDSSGKWVHYFSNQHPGEHYAQWRMVGMLEWLQSVEGKKYLKKSINHFIFMMSPDAPSKGWYRVNAEGVDMNRSYRAEGSSEKGQAHEAYICQKDLENIMASKNPVTDLWNMHTWQGAVEPLMIPGPEIGTRVGPWTELRDIIIKNDPLLLIEPLKTQALDPKTITYWTDGPHAQFGITAVLCEGAADYYTKTKNIESGKILMKSIAEYYK